MCASGLTTARHICVMQSQLRAALRLSGPVQAAHGSVIWISRAAAVRRTGLHCPAAAASGAGGAAAVAACVCGSLRARSSRAAISTRAASSSSGPSSLAGEVCSLKCCLLDVPGALAEEVAEVLLAYGAQSSAVEEFSPAGGAEQEIFADEHASGRVWDRCTVVAWFPPEEDAAAVLASTATDFGLGQLQRSVEEVRTQDWEQSIRDSYQPAEVGEGLWIVPIWSQAPDPYATNIRLEPGLAFGTGDHPTTRLCLRWLRGLQRGGSLGGASVMDYGAGSGVLAVAALLMGAERAVGTDIEPLAVKATRANAELNGVAERLTAYQCAADLGQEEPLAAAGVHLGQRLFEVTVANILQGPLVALAPRLAAYTKPGGLLGLSGILQEQVPAVQAAYAPWFDGFEVAAEDRWALVTAVRRSTDS